MGALGDYIHLQKMGYMGKNPNNQKTIFSEGQSVYKAVNKVQNDIINNYNKKSINEQIEEYQNMLNIYTGFTQRNDKKSGKKEKEIEKLAAEKMLKTVKTILEEEYPEYAMAVLTKTYDARKPSPEIREIKKLLQKETYSSKNNTKVLEILLSDLQYIQKCYTYLINNEKKVGKIDKDKKTALKNYILAIKGLINSSILKNISPEKQIISKQIDKTLQDLISSLKNIDIEELQKAMEDKNVKYKKIQEKLNTKITIGSKTIESPLPTIIQALIDLTQITINLKRMKGDALEYILAIAAEVGDPRNMAESALEEAFKNVSKKNISDRVVGTTGVSDTILNLKFIDEKYRDKIQEQMKFKTAKGDILITNTGVQEKIDVYVDLGEELKGIGVTAKNYSFDKKGEQIVYDNDAQLKGISMITDSPLLSFLQENTEESNIMGEFSNHLLNLKIQHPLMPNSEVTSNMVHNNLIKEYSILLNKIILIKSIIGEGMLRADKKGLKTINGAHLFVLNNNQTGQIVVKSTGQLVDYCINKNKKMYSVLYNSAYDDPLQELQYIKQDFKTPNDRIADIIMKLYNIKVTVKLNINFNDFANLNLTNLTE